MLHDLSLAILRDLEALVREVELYPDDESVWREVPGMPNVGGTLVLHLAANLRHFIGTTLGRTGYVRDRAAEFSARGVSREDLVAIVNAASREVGETLRALPDSALDTTYPIAVGGSSFTTRGFLLHLSVHLAYHLGQADYHRRAVTGNAASAETMSLGALAMRPADPA